MPKAASRCGWRASYDLIGSAHIYRKSSLKELAAKLSSGTGLCCLLYYGPTSLAQRKPARKLGPKQCVALR